MRLIDADKIKYYPMDRNGKYIGEMVWKPHIDGIETFNLAEHDKQIRADAIEEVICILKHRNTTILQNGYEYHGYDDDELEEIATELKEQKNE